MTELCHHVYIVFRPDGTPCYVGKGSGARWKRHNRRCAHNKHLASILAAAGGDLPVVKIRDGLTNAEACEIEVALIAAIGREANGGVLVNQTDGGEGAVGWAHSQETKSKIGRANKNPGEGTRQKLRDNPNRHIFSPAELAKSAEARRGKSLPKEHRIKISAGLSGRSMSKETRARLSASLAGNKNCVGKRNAAGLKHSAETRSRISESLRQAYATGKR